MTKRLVPLGCMSVLISGGCGLRVVGGNDDPTVHSGADAAPPDSPTDLADGTWVPVEAFTGQSFLSVDVQGPLIVAVGTFGMIYTSPDGETWTMRHEDLDTNLLGVAYSSSGYAAVGKDGKIVHSPDGITWTDYPGIASQRLRGVSNLSNGFVGVGAEIVTSPNGTTWINHGPPTDQLTAVVEVDGTLYAVGFEDSFSITSYTSVDGVSWTGHESASSDIFDLSGVCHYGGLFVAVGERGTIVTSTDGIQWTARASGTTIDLESVACGATGFAAVGQEPTLGDPAYDSGILLTSADGTSWQTKLSNETTKRMRGIDARADLAVAVGDDGTIYINRGN